MFAVGVGVVGRWVGGEPAGGKRESVVGGLGDLDVSRNSLMEDLYSTMNHGQRLAVEP